MDTWPVAADQVRTVRVASEATSSRGAPPVPVLDEPVPEAMASCEPSALSARPVSWPPASGGTGSRVSLPGWPAADRRSPQNVVCPAWSRAAKTNVRSSPAAVTQVRVRPGAGARTWPRIPPLARLTVAGWRCRGSSVMKYGAVSGPASGTGSGTARYGDTGGAGRGAVLAGQPASTIAPAVTAATAPAAAAACRAARRRRRRWMAASGGGGAARSGPAHSVSRVRSSSSRIGHLLGLAAELLAKAPAAGCQPGLDRPRRQPALPGDLGHRQVGQVVQDDHVPLAQRQRAQGGAQRGERQRVGRLGLGGPALRG